MEKEIMQEVYNTLSQYGREHYGSSGRVQSRIEESVRMYANTLSGGFVCDVKSRKCKRFI